MQIWPSKLATIPALVLLLSAGIAAQSASNWRFWDKSDGFEESYCRTIGVDAHGRLWVRHGAVSRMSVLDGYSVRKLPEPRVGPTADWTYSERVNVSPAGVPWVVENRSLKRFDGEVWRVEWSHEEGGRILSALPVADDRVLVLFSDRLCEYHPRDHSMKVIRSASQTRLESFRRMVPGVSGDVWITGLHGVAQADSAGGCWRELDTRKLGLTDLDFPLSSKPGELFFAGTAAGGRVVVRWDPSGTRIVYRGRHRNLRGWRGDSESFWVLESASLFEIGRGRKTPVDRRGVLAGVLYDIAVQPDGSFYVGSSDGLARHSPALWQTPPEARSLDLPVHAFDEDLQGRLWVAAGEFVLEINRSAWTFHPLPRNLQTQTLQQNAVLSLPDGRIALKAFEGESYDRVLIWDPETRRMERMVHPEGRDILGFSARRDDGWLWVVTGPGCRIESYDGRGFRVRADISKQWDGGNVRSVVETVGGDLWIGGTAGGGVLRKNGEYEPVSAKQGYADGMFAVAEISPGRILAGGRHTLYELEGRGWRVVRTDLDRVRSICRTRDGSLWISTMYGAYRLQDGRWIVYSDQEGLAASAVYRVFEDAAGRIWAGTSRGLSLFSPQADTEPPATGFSSGNATEISPSGDVRAGMFAVDKWKMTPLDRLLFSYRLDGGPWSGFAPAREAAFNHLHYGYHVAEARAMDRNGNIDPAPASFRFRVLVPWYLQPGFLGIVLFSGFAISVLLYLAAAQFRQRGRLILDLQAAKSAAETASAYKSQFLANMSHEIRTPMNAILGMAHLALETSSEEERNDYLRTVRDSAGSLLSILNDILDFSKVEAGRLELMTGDFSLAACIDDVVRTLGVKAEEKGISLAARIANGVPDGLRGDESRLRQVLMNLAGNAVKFTESGEVTISVSAEDRYENGSLDLHFVVADTGIGVPPEKQKVIFAPFEQVDGSITRRFGGTGLGLAITARLVELMNGRIWVKSPWRRPETGDEVDGSAFHVRVRFAEAASPILARPEPAPAVPPRPLRILVAEDNAVNQKLIVRILEKAGHNVLVAKDGAEAVDQFRKEPFDLILMDVQMPRTDGLEAAVAIRRLELSGTSRVPIVALTAHAMKGDSQLCAAAGMDGYLTKPIDIPSLHRLIAAVGSAGASATDSGPENAPPPTVEDSHERKDGAESNAPEAYQRAAPERQN
jgi:signal transduction histidine kinase/CheY-like chemotaxis protein